jgi:hypothetical protein
LFARVSTAKVSTAQLDVEVRHSQEQLPAAEHRAGFEGFYLMVNRETGEVMTISLWDTREHVEENEARSRGAQGDPAADLEVPVPDVTVYEVALRDPAE